MPEKFDVVVVGAGPAGLAAAYKLAEAGMKVIVIERGEFPGAKNVMGGIIYKKPTEAVFPKIFQEAPVERPIIEQRYYFLTDTAKIGFSYRSPRYKEDISGYSVFRAKFDRFLAKKVQEKGALLITETVVEDLIVKDGKVKGVKAGRKEGEVLADVVVLAEGAHSLLAQKYGFQKPIPPQNLAVAVKEVIGLPASVIEDRFNIEPGEGVAIELFGKATAGMVGTAFIYTNQNSLSIGVGALMSDLIKRRISPNDLIEAFKNHPAIKPLIRDGEVKEYLAHLIPEGGYKGIPRLYGDGIVIVGDAGMLVNSIHREGSNLAITSGALAAKAIIRAASQGDFSANTLKVYEDYLRESFIMKDLEKYKNAKDFLEQNHDLMTTYPDMMDEAFFELFMVDGVPKREKFKAIKEKALSKRSFWQMVKDAYGLWKGMIR